MNWSACCELTAAADLSTIDRPRALPAVLGHEGAGVVAELGKGVTDLTTLNTRDLARPCATAAGLAGGGGFG